MVVEYRGAHPETDAFVTNLINTDSATSAALRAAYLSQKNITPPSNIVAFCGDSITADTGASVAANGYKHVVPWVLGTQQMDQIWRAFATGGYTSAQVLTTHIPSACVSDAGVVHFAAGTNDADTGVTVTQFMANVIAAYNLIRASGKLMSISHIPPRPSAATAQWRKDRAAYNDAISRWAARVGVPIADTSVLADPATGYMNASYQFDTTHPNDLGHAKLAEAVAVAVGKLLVPQGYRMPKSPDVNLLTNPVMGTTPAAGMPLNWAETSGGTGDAPSYATVADTSGLLQQGLWLQMDWNAATTGGVRTVSGGGPTLNTNFAANDLFEFGLLMQVVDLGGFQTAVEAGTASVQVIETNTSGGLQAGLLPAVRTLKLGRLAFRIAAPNTTFPGIAVKVTIPSGVHVQVRWGEAMIRNLTALGLVGQYPAS